MFKNVGNVRMFFPVPDYIHKQVIKELTEKMAPYFPESQTICFKPITGPDMNIHVTILASGGIKLDITETTDYWTPPGWTTACGVRHALEEILSALEAGKNPPLKEANDIIFGITQKVKDSFRAKEEPLQVEEKPGDTGITVIPISNNGSRTVSTGFGDWSTTQNNTSVGTVLTASRGPQGMIGSSGGSSLLSEKDISDAVKTAIERSTYKESDPLPLDPSLTPLQRRIKMRLRGMK